MKISHRHLLRLIAIFKFFKTALLVALGIGALKLLHKYLGVALTHCVEALRLNPGERFINAALGKAAHLKPEQVTKISLGSFLYAALFLAEGTGLCIQKRWGEWLTVIITSSLVPIEAYEILRHFSILKVVVLLANLAIVAYLVYHIRLQPQPKASRKR
jgi:uncharacterized membrane protein (DUF2068 family)